MRLSFILFFTGCFFPVVIKAQSEKVISSKINSVTVFLRGAEMIHNANATLVKGENEITIEGLSPEIGINSLKIKATGGVVISAYEFSKDFLTSVKSTLPLLKNLEDSIQLCQSKLDKINIDLKINTNMMDHLQKGVAKNISGSEKGLGITELKETMDYYKSKSEQMETLQASLNKQKKEMDATIRRLKLQFEQESLKGNKASGVLKLMLTTPRAGNSLFTITYFTESAGWIPYYDINITSIDKPILISQKSKVRQMTGLDWEKVKLSLSTALPSNGKVAPLFSAWFLQERHYRPAPDFRAAVQNSFSYEDRSVNNSELGERLEKKISGLQTISSYDNGPLVIIDGRQTTQEELNAIDPAMIKDMQVLKDASSTAIYGSRGSNGVIVVSLKNTMDDYVVEADNAMSVVYNIDLPYTIPGNGKEQNIDLQNKEVSAEYKYYCAPKLDTETYLLAEISNWEKLGLLSGKANITYDNTYIGETFIDATSTHSKLTLTLGTDKRVVVKREKMRDYSATKSLGNDIQQTFVYHLTVKNNLNKPVHLVLKDQYPISTQKKIEVNLLKDTTPWTANKEEVGVITWEEDFAAGETRTYKVSYSVKYPKEMILNI